MFENIPKPEEIPENKSEQENNSDDGGLGEVAAEIIGGIIEIAAEIIGDD